MSSPLYLKTFIRKRETASSILVLALLVAILASVNSIVNYLNAQVDVLAGLIDYGERFIVVNGSSISDSELDVELLSYLRSLQQLDYISLQRYAWLEVSFNSKSVKAPVRGIDDLEAFLKARGIRLNGSIARSINEAVVGELLANAHFISVGTEINLTCEERSASVIVVGAFRSGEEIDSEVVVPIETIFNLMGEETASFIEFSFKRGAKVEEALVKLSSALPEGVKVIRVRQPATFAQQINVQTVGFLSFWSLAVYAVIASASYVIASKVVRESRYEISLLKALGAKRGRILVLILLYVIIIATSSSIIGSSMGLVGAQVVSTALSWLTPSIRVEPFLEPLQLALIISTASSSMVLGSLHPVYKASKARYVEGL